MKALISPTQNNLVAQVATKAFPVAEPLYWINCPSGVVAGYFYVDGEFLPPPPIEPPLSTEEIVSAYIAHIQKRLDAFANTRGFDSALSCCTYATSSVPKFAAEGQYMVIARDITRAKVYEILSDVESGARPVPTLEELDAELPALAWPA